MQSRLLVHIHALWTIWWVEIEGYTYRQKEIICLKIPNWFYWRHIWPSVLFLWASMHFQLRKRTFELHQSPVDAPWNVCNSMPWVTLQLIGCLLSEIVMTKIKKMNLSISSFTMIISLLLSWNVFEISDRKHCKHLMHHCIDKREKKLTFLSHSIFKGCSGAGEGMRCDSVNSLGGHEPGCPSAQGSQGSRHLLDDSELDPPPHDCTSPPSLTRTWWVG